MPGAVGFIGLGDKAGLDKDQEVETALAEDQGHVYEAIPGTGHLLQLQKPAECRRSMLACLDEQRLRY